MAFKEISSASAVLINTANIIYVNYKSLLNELKCYYSFSEKETFSDLSLGQNLYLKKTSLKKKYGDELILKTTGIAYKQG